MRTVGRIVVLSAAIMLVAAPAAAQRVGVVTTAQGQVTLARASAPPAPLKFREDVLVRDRITTGEHSLARILFGGRAVVTVSERSMLTVTDSNVTSVIEMGRGRLALAVARERMAPGASIEIRTPNAVAAVRGTVVVAEVLPSDGAPGGVVSRFTVLKGLVDVSRFDPRSQVPLGPAVSLRAREQVEISRAANVIRTTLSEAGARRLAGAFTVSPASQPIATKATSDEHIREAMKHAARFANEQQREDRRGPGGRSSVSDDGKDDRDTADRERDDRMPSPRDASRRDGPSNNRGSGAEGFKAQGFKSEAYKFEGAKKGPSSVDRINTVPVNDLLRPITRTDTLSSINDALNDGPGNRNKVKPDKSKKR
ncbi:MAG: FecR domain-containing protein [Candidatus Rokubacteria bacterium]|nr:FecR domain-containing protein [Candidatus Rokubacteria bacterium]